MRLDEGGSECWAYQMMRYKDMAISITLLNNRTSVDD